MKRTITTLSLFLTFPFLSYSEEPSPAQARQPQSKPKIIVSGFQNFGGRSINASSELAKSITDAFPHLNITFIQVPVVWGAPERTILENQKLKPAVWIAFGEGTEDFQIETVANNRRAELRDNRNQLPTREEISLGGPEQLTTTISAERISVSLQKLGYTPRISSDAGKYLCEEMLYALLSEQQVHHTTLKEAVFIHVPIYGSTVRIHGKDVTFSGENLRTAAVDLFQAITGSLQLNSGRLN